MKLVVQVKLLPTPEQAATLRATLAACNEAASHVSELAFAQRRFHRFDVQNLAYQDLKEVYGLSAQPALRVIKKVCDAYAILRAGAEAGSLRGRGSRRRATVEPKPVCFRPEAAQPFDDRCLSWQPDARTVSVWTVAGRLKGLVFTGSDRDLEMLADHRSGESDLVFRNGNWFLLATCEVPEAAPNTSPAGWLGVDLGIVNIATTSDEVIHAGGGLNRYRRNQIRIRSELQAKGTKSAKRKLGRRSKKEARHAANVNHVISKSIVAEAERTGRGIALEDLRGIRDRARLRKPQQAALHSWSFQQLGAFIAYKAKRAGVPVVYVDPAYSSQECSWCGHTEKRNRLSQAEFACRSCGIVAHADHNAARNHAARAQAAWAAVNRPHAADTPQPVAGTSSKPRAKARDSRQVDMPPLGWQAGRG